MYKFSISKGFDKIFSKLKKKDTVKYEQIKNKITKICKNPDQGKPLRNIMKCTWRTQIGEFVLIYEIIESEKLVKFLRYRHHNEAYKT